MKKPVTLLLSLSLLALAQVPALALEGQYVSVTTQSVSGSQGHAFVYAEVTESGRGYPAPAGSHYQSPYYSIWTPLYQYWLPAGDPCQWLWLIYVYDKATNKLINGDPSVGVVYFRTKNTLCASGSSTPVGMPVFNDAQAQLSLDLQVSLSPSQPLAGSQVSLIGVLSGRLRNDLDVYLSMAITDWAVDRWVADFGDGQSITVTDQRGDYVSVPHTYATAGSYNPRLTAYISGHAQAAVYDGFGNPYLVTRAFTVQISNSAHAQPGRQAARGYLQPNVIAAVAPVIDGSGLAPANVAFQHVDALRGTLTDFYIHPLILQEGYITLDGRPTSAGHTILIAWRYAGPPTDAPASVGTVAGPSHSASDPMRLQWNQPDALVGTASDDYAVPVILRVRTTYPDGHMAVFTFESTFSVTVNFAAQNG
jgi:hypothetical protein